MRKRASAGLSAKSNKGTFFSSVGICVLFVGACVLLFSQAFTKKNQVCAELRAKISELEQLKQCSLEKKEDLVLQIHSQEDMRWVEMVLKKRLGVVPEGQMKVYFKKDS